MTVDLTSYLNRDLIALLSKMDKKVFLVSGGFRRIIGPIAAALSIPIDHVYANRFLFSEGTNIVHYIVFIYKC